MRYHNLLAVLWPCLQYMETLSSRQMDMQKFIADGCREALLEEKRRFCFLADKHCMFSYQISNFHEKVSIDGELIPHSRTPLFMDSLTPSLLLSLVFPGQRDAVLEAPQLAGKVLRHHQRARHGDEHDRGAGHHSRTIAAGWALQQGECELVVCGFMASKIYTWDKATCQNIIWRASFNYLGLCVAVHHWLWYSSYYQRKAVDSK